MSFGKHRPGRDPCVFNLRNCETGVPTTDFPTADRFIQTVAVHGLVLQLCDLPDPGERTTDRYYKVLQQLFRHQGPSSYHCHQGKQGNYYKSNAQRTQGNSLFL